MGVDIVLWVAKAILVFIALDVVAVLEWAIFMPRWTHGD